MPHSAKSAASSPQSALQIGFIGAGRMATALARGLIDAGFAAAGQILASDVEPAAREGFARSAGAAVVEGNADVVARADVLVLAVKPQSMSKVLEELRPLLKPSHLVISIAAGVTLSALSRALGERVRLVRVMPNTPCLVGQGASGFSVGGTATSDDAAFTESLLKTVGIAVQVPEPLLDAVTGLSGSGPAYAFEMIEALSDGGVCAGLPRDVATRLAAQTLLGAAKMVLATGQHPGALKDAVASPGGTTIAGLHELERGGLRGTLMNAVVAATRRSQELGRS
ncbi:MAG: pyrroline-5-carboxylate reductase [Planctomycetaceae bacterium]